jgi:hypothetical protein
LQAKWIELFFPAFKNKERLQAGADADIVIFDPDTVKANANYGTPYENPPKPIALLPEVGILLINFIVWKAVTPVAKF